MSYPAKLFTAILAVVSSLNVLAQVPVSFQSAAIYTVGTNPIAAKAADFNGDGMLDLAVLNSGSNDVSILLGNGDGTFQLARHFPLGNASALASTEMVVGDFNGDRKLDIAVLLPSLIGEVRILMGNGDGTLQRAVPTALNLQASSGITAVDVNGDGRADLLVNLFDGSNPSGLSLNLLLGNGDGTFAAPKLLVSGSQPVIVVGDFNNDKKIDIVIGVVNGIEIMFGQGDGTFVAGPTIFAADPNTAWFSTDDVNNDGNLDFVVNSNNGSCAGFNCSGTQHLGVILGKSDNTFGSEQVFAQGGWSYTFFRKVSNTVGYIATGDLNGDGIPDVLDVRNAGTLEVRLGAGNGTFLPNDANLDPTLLLPFPGSPLLMSDLDGDQLADVVVADPSSPSAIGVLRNSTPVFTMSASQMKLTAVGGQQVTDTISIGAHNGFSSAVQLSCEVSGAAPAPTCAVSPTDVAAGATATLTVNVPTSAGLLLPGSLRVPLYASAFPFALLVLSFGTKCSRIPRRWLLVPLLAMAALILGSCGGANPPAHQVKSYSVAVTAASNTLIKTVQIALTVQ